MVIVNIRQPYMLFNIVMSCSYYRVATQQVVEQVALVCAFLLLVCVCVCLCMHACLCVCVNTIQTRDLCVNKVCVNMN